jgi:hypothetical protein
MGEHDFTEGRTVSITPRPCQDRNQRKGSSAENPNAVSPPPPRIATVLQILPSIVLISRLQRAGYPAIGAETLTPSNFPSANFIA